MEFAPSEGAGTQVPGLTLLLVCVSVYIAAVTVCPQAGFTSSIFLSETSCLRLMSDSSRMFNQVKANYL